MELNIIVILVALLIIVIFWIAVGIRHLKFLKKEIEAQWESIDEGLRKRQSLIPNLIETVRGFGSEKENLFQQLIERRQKAVKMYAPGIERIELENDLTVGINALCDIAKEKTEMAKDTNFLELRKEIDDLEQSVEEKTKKYNEMVRYYNEHRRFVLLKPIAVVFKYPRLNIFEMER